METLIIAADIIAVSLGITAIVMAINSEKRSKIYFDKILKIEKSIDKKIDSIDQELDDYFQEEK